MKHVKNKQVTIFLILMIVWYLTSFFIPYNALANSLGVVNFGYGHSWPLSFFLMDVLVICLEFIFLVMVKQGLRKKSLKLYWVLLAALLVYPLITVWATLQDLIFSPIAP